MTPRGHSCLKFQGNREQSPGQRVIGQTGDERRVDKYAVHMFKEIQRKLYLGGRRSSRC